ncbi:hypothetical protein QYF61_007067 [Mycteria americana]|uniref:Reverse transcriptase n=1 Tax=Mycteria americana TaxID=33587 RepID=A0AAN7S4R7_MYCAM|nr:hypothetical protein QYF61_007067 [Mycteria americana]
MIPAVVVGHKQFRRFMECICNFLTQVIKEPMNGSSLVDLINKEELVWDVKLSDSFAWSDHKMLEESSIWPAEGPAWKKERINLEIFSKRKKYKKVIGSSQQGFMKEKSCLAKMMAFYNEMTGSVNEVSAVHVFCLGFSKAFGTVSHKLIKYRQDKWSLTCIENWLNCWTERVVLSSTNFSWRPVTGSVPQGLILALLLSNDVVK